MTHRGIIDCGSPIAWRNARARRAAWRLYLDALTMGISPADIGIDYRATGAPRDWALMVGPSTLGLITHGDGRRAAVRIQVGYSLPTSLFN